MKPIERFCFSRGVRRLCCGLVDVVPRLAMLTRVMSIVGKRRTLEQKGVSLNNSVQL